MRMSGTTTEVRLTCTGAPNTFRARNSVSVASTSDTQDKKGVKHVTLVQVKLKDLLELLSYAPVASITPSYANFETTVTSRSWLLRTPREVEIHVPAGAIAARYRGGPLGELRSASLTISGEPIIYVDPVKWSRVKAGLA